MGIDFQKEMESTTFHPEAFIILTALRGTLTGKDAGEPMASKLTTGATSKFLRVSISVQSSADIRSHRCDSLRLVLRPMPNLGQVIYHTYGHILGTETQLLTCPVKSASTKSLNGLQAS